MDEQLLAGFLRGEVSAAELGPALLEARLHPDSPTFKTSANYRVVPLASAVKVAPAQIDRLVSAVESGQLSEDQAGIAAFLLESGLDRFQWDTDTVDGERVGKVLFWLGMPVINYPLTPRNLAAMREYLRTGKPMPDDNSERAGA